VTATTYKSKVLLIQSVNSPPQAPVTLSFRMISFTHLVLAAAAVIGAVAAPSDVTERDTEGLSLLQARAGTPSATGTNNGYYYSWWTDGAATAYYTNGSGGQYTIQWSGNAGNLVGGKGWNPGSNSR
jgi:endo-1,4-beta-xylanase